MTLSLSLSLHGIFRSPKSVTGNSLEENASFDLILTNNIHKIPQHKISLEHYAGTFKQYFIPLIIPTLKTITLLYINPPICMQDYNVLLFSHINNIHINIHTHSKQRNTEATLMAPVAAKLRSI